MSHGAECPGDCLGISDDDPPSAALPQMQCPPFEHYDYIVLVFRNEQDFQQACERLAIKSGRTKAGLGRVIDGTRAVKQLIGVNP